MPQIQALQALLRRIPNNHPERVSIEEELSKQLAGFAGEQSLQFNLSFLSNKEYQILQNIRLKNPPYFFQIDYLVICPRFLLILEVKNYSGQLYFDSQFGQLIQTKDDKEKAFPNPLVQVQMQKYHLQTWLTKHQIPNIPIETLIIIANPYTVIKANPKYKLVFEKVLHKEHLLSKIEKFNKAHTSPLLTTRKMKRVSTLINEQHTPLIPDLLNRYKINEVNSGVHCPSCYALPMHYKHGSWHCPTCSHISKTAHYASLRDYALLIKPTITNQECRQFLHLHDVHACYYLLSKLNLHYVGTGKGRVYSLNLG